MDIFFTREHEWVVINGGMGTIGITEYAAHQLGDITFVELPKTGIDVKKGQAICSIESVKAASDIYSPVSGKIAETNKDLESKPELINEKAESDGWIAKIELSNPDEKSGLMDRKQYDDFLKGL